MSPATYNGGTQAASVTVAPPAAATLTLNPSSVKGGSVNSTATVKFRAYDNVGNLESNHAIQIQIDPTAPTVSLTAPSAGARIGRSSKPWRSAR